MTTPESYPFATDLHPTGQHPTYDRLTKALARARFVDAWATQRHAAAPSPVSLSIARSAAHAQRVAAARWVRYAFTADGQYNANGVILP